MGSIDKGDGASIRSFGTQATKTPGGISEEGLRGAGTEIAGVLFGLNEDWLAKKLKELQGVCTEQAALDDFKVNYKSITCADGRHCSNASIQIIHSRMDLTISQIQHNGPPTARPKSRYCPRPC
jgi:hypothetical protein